MGASTKEMPHRWVDALDDDEAARLSAAIRNEELLADLDDEPLTAEDIAAMKQGARDLDAGRAISLEDYRRKRGL